MLAFFRRQNGRAFFPPLPIAALLRRSWRGIYSTPAGWDVTVRPDFFRKAKGQREIKSTLAFSASHEARRRMAVERSQAAFLRALCAHSAQSGVKGHCPLREPRGLSPSGGKTPAKLHVSLRPAPKGRGVGCRGAAPAS